MEYRNVAIIAHVDHGKTTLVDGLLRQADALDRRSIGGERVMDSEDLERERGITILAKNASMTWQDVTINVVDTPGHADFGGEVERALGMVDGALVLVDAAEGPMPQTRFVLEKALAAGLAPVLVLNKIDRDDARPDEVSSMVFDLMAELGANEAQLDFPILHAVATEGRAWREDEAPTADLASLFRTIVEVVPADAGDAGGPALLQVANLAYDKYVGRLAIGRLRRGRMRTGDTLTHLARDGSEATVRLGAVYTHAGLARREVDAVEAGDIVALAGVPEAHIGDTLAAPEMPERLPTVPIEEPTVRVTVMPNGSPFAGREGRFLTSRHIGERLEREALTNVALRVEPLGGERFRVAGRGELHLAILLETMRREGFELAVSPPEVIHREENGQRREPYERVVVDVPNASLGSVIEALNERRGELLDLRQGEARARAEFRAPSRGLFGFRTSFLTLTAGEGLFSTIFDGFGTLAGEIKPRRHGSLLAAERGAAMPYALFKLQDRGTFFIDPGTEVYAGMIVGAHIRPGDLEVNVTRAKKLTNVRAAGSDDNVVLTPPRRLNLEDALGYLAGDELLEVTPADLRLRKRLLDPNERKKDAKRAAAAGA